MKRIIFTLGIIFASILSSCTDAKRGKMFAYGDKFKVELINCDGTVAREWTTTGKVLSEETSDGYYFTTTKGEFIEVSGTIIITKIK